MKLNRRQRRARGQFRPHAADTPAQQMKAFLKQPGKIHIVQLPDEKSFVVKVTDKEMPLFLTMCAQLNAVLGFCEATPATPVEASVATPEQIAQQTANDPHRLRIAQQRQDDAEAARGGTVDDSMQRHPAGKRPSGGRHAKPEPDTTFDKLVNAGPVDDDGARRLAAMQIAAAQDEANRAADALEAANERLRQAREHGGELHNEHIVNQFTEQAGEVIAQVAEQPDEPGHFPAPEVHRAWSGDGPYIEARAEDATPVYPQFVVSGPGNYAIGGEVAEQPHEWAEQHEHQFKCPFCPAKVGSPDKEVAAQTFADHIAWHRKSFSDRLDEYENCSCPRNFIDDSRSGTNPRCKVHGPDQGKPLRVITDNPQG